MLDRSDQEPLDEKGNSFLYCGMPRETNNDYLKALGLPVRSTCTPATPDHSPCSLTSSALLCRPLSFAALSIIPPPPFPFFSLPRRLIVHPFPSGQRLLNYGFFFPNRLLLNHNNPINTLYWADIGSTSIFWLDQHDPISDRQHVLLGNTSIRYIRSLKQFQAFLQLSDSQ
jgi:hypothetical protein